ncbi:MBL fold metallo-hydrolase [Marinagarivorans algicola]|uniref:MBL fold metallo-hydrolase n=1 Tax=Marinagarivorans algicola TaxID=1513270 RepID=UPI0006B88542|nr:MBL fold metallo-hydrolase [Marinagarivorans algicola]
MQFASLGSGSEGNATLIQSGKTLLLLDCGFSLKGLSERLKRLALTPADITAVLVTHEHADHIRGVGPLTRKYGTAAYMSAGTASAKTLGKIPHTTVIAAGEILKIGSVDIEVHSVPHDAREPTQFIFNACGRRLGVLTDLGSIPDELAQRYSDLDALLLEANHDPEMLARGSYPASLKQRVGGYWGHLSNQQSAQLIEQINVGRLQHLVLAHISQKNNSQAHVMAAFAGLPAAYHLLQLADQNTGFDWLPIT